MMRQLLFVACLGAGCVVSARGAEVAVGKPLASDVLKAERSGPRDAEVRLTLNEEKDRVGATYYACESHAYDKVPECDTVSFVFPDLSYDRESGRIMRGEEVVAVDRGWRGISLEKGFRLEPRVAVETADDGFNRVEVRRLQVVLVKSP